MLKYLFEEWTDFRSVFRFELHLSRTLISVKGVYFVVMLLKKFARSRTANLKFWCPVYFVFPIGKFCLLMHMTRSNGEFNPIYNCGGI